MELMELNLFLTYYFYSVYDYSQLSSFYIKFKLCFSKVFTTFHFADENEYLKICNKKTLN